jgi:hypothetical protein
VSREWLRDIVFDIERCHPDETTGDKQRMLCARVRRLAECGDGSAECRLQMWEQDGAAKEYRDILIGASPKPKARRLSKQITQVRPGVWAIPVWDKKRNQAGLQYVAIGRMTVGESRAEEDRLTVSETDIAASRAVFTEINRLTADCPAEMLNDDALALQGTSVENIVAVCN